MKKVLRIFTLLLFIISCSNKISPESDIKKRTAPFGTKKVADNVYVDKAEIRNIDYKEYLYWTSLIYGEDSAFYKNALPDETVWLSAPKKFRKFETVYFRAMLVIGAMEQ